MKISRFCWNMELSSAALGLGICGVVMSIIYIGFFTYLFFMAGNFAPAIQYMYAIVYVIGTVGLLLSLGWLLFSFILLSNAKEDDKGGKWIIKISVKKIIKIGSFIIGTIQTILGCVSALASIGYIIQLALGVGIGGVATITLVLCSLWLIISIIFLIFPTLLIYGMYTKSSKKLKTWIIFQFILWGLHIVYRICLLSLGFTNLITGLLTLAFTCIFYMYITGMVIVHYNIILEENTKDEHGWMNRNFQVINVIALKQKPTVLYLPNSFMVYR